MRTLELVIIFLDLVIVLLRFVPRRLRGEWAVAPLTLAVLVLHFIFELPRWQMVPLYGLTLLLIAINLVELWGMIRWHRLGWTIFLLVILGLFSLPPFLFPVPSLPVPSGPFSVGTATFEWVDETREETLAAGPVGKRRLVVQVWYPAAVGPGAEPGPYMSELESGSAAVAREFGFPPFMLSHLGLARTHSYPNAPLATAVDRFPVLVFSHGWNGLRVQNTYQVEELASHGYVVFAPDHTYGSAVTTFLDGTTILNRPELLPSGSSQEYAAAIRKIGQAWVGDIRFIFDQVEKLNQGRILGFFQSRLNVDRMGVLGHSTGGGAAVQACYSDTRCKAGLAMDAWMEPYERAVVEQGLSVPFFFFQNEKGPVGRNASLLPGVYDHMQAPAWRLAIAGAKHFDFSDIAMLTPLAPMLGIKGPIDGARMLEIVNVFSVAFFNQNLRSRSSPLLEGPGAAYPEITFERKN